MVFQELLIIETQNLHHWIWHASNPEYSPLKPFQCVLPSQNQQNVKFLAVCWTPPDKKWKKNKICQFVQRKSAWKGLKIYTCRFLHMLIIMHYVRTLYDKYLFSYSGFSWFLTGRFRHRVIKCGVVIEWDTRSTAA